MKYYINGMNKRHKSLMYLNLYLAWIWLLMGSFGLLAMGDLAGAQSGDFRSQCRLAVGGLLVSTISEMDRAQTILSSWQTRVGRLKIEQAKWQAKEKSLLEQINQNPFDPTLEEQLQGLQYKITLVNAELEQGAAIAKKEEKIWQEKSVFRSRLTDRIKPIFSMTERSDPTKEGYDFKVSYRHSCGRFQHVCPLPSDQRLLLRSLAKDFSELAVCEKYANILPPR